jgi:ABC-type oligopeptide transport system substrate-binding subunit/DNA-binding SARP family transcriptional activator
VSTLRLYFLGPLDIRYDDQPLPKPPTLKSQSLLAYLILHRRQPQPRERLAGLFWGDRPERKARHSLATALWHIRRCLPADYILSDPQTVQFDPQADLWLDVDEFESYASHDDIARLQSAVALYRGHFLDGFYDDWIINERYRLEALFCEALARLMVAQEARGEHEAALSTALRLLDHDLLREDAHRLAMRAYGHLGQRNAALEQYRRCREIVGEELGAEPMAETTELYQAILEGRFAVERAPEILPVQIPAMEPLVPPGRSPLDVMALSPLVGREREVAFLREYWQGAGAGQGGLILISGEAGVGKTRLVEEVAQHLRWQGVRVLWGRCYEFERLLPYQPVAEALRAILPTVTSAELAAFPTWTVAEVARLVPEMVEHFPDLEAPASIPSDQEQARLFDGVARFLAEMSSHSALLVVLEDLHWASESTLQLIHYLVRHHSAGLTASLAGHPVLMVGTFRPEAVGQEHPLLTLQRQLSQERLCQSLRLSRLSPKAVEAMVLEMSGAGEAVVPLAGRLYQETEGNPFFLMEIVKALFETDAIRLEGRAWQGDFSQISEGELPLPAGVSEAIQARVHRLGDDAQEALHLAAVLGREFDFDLLNTVWGRGEGATLEALDDLLRHRLIDEGSGAMGRDYAFAHHKIQEIVYAGMPRRRRGHAHAQVGAALESLYGTTEAETLAGELAFHFEQGRQLDKALTEKAISYLLQAGDRARGLYAHQEAIDYYQRALALLKEQGEHGQAARTLMKLGLTYHTAFDFRQARQAYEEGFALWQRAGEMEQTILPPAPHALRVSWPEPTTLDPAISHNIFSNVVIDQLFSGLAEVSPELEVLPDLARTWEVSEGGRKYIFHLRDDARWSDGTPVTAGDFAYAWKRVLAPVTGSPNADLLYDIKGARAFHQGDTSDPDRVGVGALDEVTLVVELEGPTSYFPHLLVSHPSYPVPRHVVEAHGAAWTDAENIVTNGPFKLEAWKRGESLALVRNPEYRGPFTGNVQRVELFALEWSVALERYEADGLDVWDLWHVPPPTLDHARQRHAADYVSSPWLATIFVGFDASQPPFDDPRLRRAFVHAIDRETLADMVMRGSVFPGTGGFVPPGMPGHSAGTALPHDPDRAQRLLAEAGYPSGRGFPVVDALIFRGAVPEYLRAQWRENLGVEIRWQIAMDWATFRDRLDRERPHIFGVGQHSAYADPDYLLRACFARRWTRWRNESYDRLVEEARRVADQKERIKLYHKADTMMVQEAAIMPLGYTRLHLLVKPWVSRFPTSAIKRWFCTDTIIEPH